MGFFMALPDIKRIHVYLNGNAYYPGTNFIVHPRRIRNYEIFLKDLTDKLRPSFGAIRNVYTPVNGSRVRDLEDLENNQRYVAAGRETFHRLQYTGIEQQQAMKRALKKSTKTSKPPPKLQKSLARTFRRRPYPWEPVVIHIYRNGDDVSPAVKLAVRRSDLDNWEQLLLRAGEKLDKSGYVKRLYNLNGDWVRGPNGIKNGEYYVAVGGYETFKHVMYGELLDRLPKEFIRGTAAPKPRRKPKPVVKDAKEAPKKIIPKIKAPPILKKPKTIKAADNAVGGQRTDRSPNAAKSQSNVNGGLKLPTKSTTASRMQNSNKSTGNTTRSNILNKKKGGKSPPDSEDSAYISEGESRNRKKTTKTMGSSRRRSFEVLNGVPPSGDVYYASPTRKPRTKRVTMVDYDEDEGGVYKAKTRSPESRYAREVQELRHLPVDLPIDEVEATEVGEEAIRRVEEEDEEEDDERSDPEENYTKKVSRVKDKSAFAIENARMQLPSPTPTA